MLNKFLPPKWKHRNPDVRREAVENMAIEEPDLALILASDEDAAIRRIALRRITCISTILEAAESNDDDSVRDAARKRGFQLLAEAESSEPGLKALNRNREDTELAEYLLQHAAHAEVRKQALEMTGKPSPLAATALNDPEIELRLAAVNKVSRIATLDRIAREAKGKDKRVCQLARERAEALREIEQRPRRIEELISAIENLAEQKHADPATLKRLTAQWNEVKQHATGEQQDRVAAMTGQAQRCIDQAEKERQEIARQRKLCEQAESLLRDLEEKALPDETALADVAAAEEVLCKSWHEGRATDSEKGQFEARFKQAIERIERCCERTRQHQQRYRQQCELLEEMKQWMNQPEQLQKKRLNQWRKEWQKIARDDVDAALQERYEQLVSRVEKSIADDREQTREIEERLEQWLKELDKALADGQLAKATSLYDRARSAVARLGASSSRFNTRLHKRMPRLRELKDWNRFGTDQVREELIGEMRKLTESTMAPAPMEREIRRLSDKWRNLDRRNGAAPEEVWERFKSLADAAYAPVNEEKEKRLAQWKATQQKRSSFCDELETVISVIDDERPDWKDLDRQIADARRQWRGLGGVSPKQWQRLNNRFQSLLKAADEMLAPEKKREIERRERLIADLENRLATVEAGASLDEVIEAAKLAQAKWEPSVRASRKEEQRLWKAFRCQCDDIFSRRKQQRDQYHRETDQLIRKKSLLCEQMEALAGQEGMETREMRKQAERISREWKESSGRLPAAANRDLNNRYRQAEKAIATAQVNSRIAARKMKLQVVSEAARRCEEFESLILNTWPTGTVEIDAIRKKMDDLPAEYQQRMEKTLSLLEESDQAAEEIAARAEANLLELRQRLLELEIMLDVETPQAFATERREWQLENLSAAMHGELNQESRGKIGEQIENLYLTGPLSSEGLQLLQERRDAVARAAIESQKW